MTEAQYFELSILDYVIFVSLLFVSIAVGVFYAWKVAKRILKILKMFGPLGPDSIGRQFSAEQRRNEPVRRGYVDLRQHVVCADHYRLAYRGKKRG